MYIHTWCKRAANTLVSLRIRVTQAFVAQQYDTTNILCAGSNNWCYNGMFEN